MAGRRRPRSWCAESTLTGRTPSAGCGWGMTETCATFTHHLGEDYAHRPDSCGPATPVGEMKVVDADGRELPPGEVGELWVYGPHVARRYWNKPEATAATFRDGWLKTGDLARLDEEGFCYIVDRLKDVIIRGGENIYSAEVEDVLYAHPAVMDAALVPIPHPTLGEEPGAVVTLKPGHAGGRGRAEGPRPRAPGAVQDARARDRPARAPAAQSQRQDPQVRAEAPVRSA